MKKFVLSILFTIFTLSSFAETIYGTTTDCMIYNNSTKSWESIGNGRGIDVFVDDFNNLFIYSSEPQKFMTYDVSDMHINKSGHEQFTAYAIDANGERCGLRFVFRDDIEAPMQIYIHYNNIDYVYNVIIRQ